MIRPDAGNWSGFVDRFGERATEVDADGRSVDLLRLFAAFTPASLPLVDRIALLDVDRPAVSRAIALERDQPSDRLILISEHVPGVRLSELLRTAGQRSVVADLGAALFVMRRLLTLAESLRAATGLAHFSIAPERIVITPHGRVVIVEPALGAAAETVGIATNDIAGIAIAGMSIMLGHLIEDAEHIDPLSPVLQDAADVAAIRAGHRFSTAVRLWFDRAIIGDPSLSFRDFREARLALARVGLVRESGCDASRRTLKAFLNDLAIVDLTGGEAGTLEITRLRGMRATRLARWKAISAPDEEWISVEDELFIGDESRPEPEAILRAFVDRSEPADENVEIGLLAEPESDASAEEAVEAVRVEERYIGRRSSWNQVRKYSGTLPVTRHPSGRSCRSRSKPTRLRRQTPWAKKDCVTSTKSQSISTTPNSWSMYSKSRSLRTSSQPRWPRPINHYGWLWKLNPASKSRRGCLPSRMKKTKQHLSTPKPAQNLTFSSSPPSPSPNWSRESPQPVGRSLNGRNFRRRD